MTAGTATNRPMAVMMSASPTGPATLIEGALQNCLSTTRADCLSLRWSHSLVSMTYHEASDMMSSSTSTARAMMSPVAQSAARPYGLSVETVAWFSMVFLEAKKAPHLRVRRCESFGHLELDAEIETTVDGLAILGGGYVVSGAGLGEIDRPFIQACAA